jgi:hypothetical protein
MTQTITLTNTFHNTESRLQPAPYGNGTGYVSRKTALRVRRELCGVEGCTCGGEFGQRGSAIDVIRMTADRGYIVCMGA